MGISFSSAKDLRNRIKILPSGPIWLTKEMPTDFPTLGKVQLYYRNPLQCLQSLLYNPLFSDSLEFAPYRIYQDNTKTVRVFTEWLSGDAAWEIQASYMSIKYCLTS